jgi:hypothetical protein
MGRTTARGVVGTPAYIAPEQARDTREASVASDVYSLGATLLFAATGHPPYQGATVMDVLARLASEEPDLSGLPDELTELIAGCMHRVPRQRPTSSAILVQLGDFTVAQAGPYEEHSYLPEKAMALIGEYQRSPQLSPAGPLGSGSGDDATNASYTELPASYKPAPRRKPGRGRTPPGAPAGSQGSGWRRWLREHMAWAGWASVGAALVVVGVILGAALSGSSAPSQTRSSPTGSALPAGGPPAPPDTVCGSSGQGTQGLCMVGQSLGSARLAWVVRGHGLPPRTPVTVQLTWIPPPQDPPQTVVRTAKARPVTGADGTVRLNIGQLFPGALKLGLFGVKVTWSGGGPASTTFIVIPG